LFLYIKSATGEKYNLKPIDGIHLIPFLIILIYSVINFHIKDIDTQTYLIQNGGVLDTQFVQIMDIGFLVLFITYLVLSMNLLIKYKIKIKNQFSNPKSLNFSWFYILLVFLFAIWIFVLANFLLSLCNLPNSLLLYLIVKLLILFLFLYISFSGFKDRYVFLDVKSQKKYQQSRLSQSEILKYSEEIVNYFDKMKPYLNPDLNLNEVSEYLNMPARNVSQIINEGCNQNFYDIVNKFRIEEAKSLLKSYSPEEKTVSEIMYNVGYETKSAFYKAFKKFTNSTPMEYRKK
jgi:AraC-like DNA-binding protein